MAKSEGTRTALIKHMKKGKGAHPDADVKKLVKPAIAAKRKSSAMKPRSGRGR